jgi:hypothetical protein
LGVRIDNILSNTDAAALDSLTEIVAAFQGADSTINGAITSLSNTAAANLAAEVARAEGAEADLAADIGAEVTRATAAEGVLTSAVAAEVARATAAEAVLQTAIDTEHAHHVAGDATNAAAIQSEVTRATAAEVSLGADLATEVARATAAEGVLTSAVAAEATTARAAEGVLSTNLAAEVARATAAEGVLTAAVSQEATDRIAGDATNATAIANEVTRASGVEDGLNTRVTTVEGQVNGKIGDLTTLTTSDTSSLVGAINSVVVDLSAEATARADADAAIRSDYNSKQFTFQSGAAATTHVVSHNLDASFVSFTVLVERADGTYRNDIVSVTETSTNVLTVYLSESAKIKMSVHSMGNL